MKIPITRTELYGMQDFAWNLFCRHIKNRSDNFTPVQEIAALCFIYYTEIYDKREWGDTDPLENKDINAIEEKDWYHGHLDFFDHCDESDIDIDSLAQALESIGTSEFADNLLKAAESRYENNCFDEDTWFVENEKALLDAIREYWQDHLDDFYEITDENYSLRPPKDGFWVGIFILAIICILMVIAAFTNPDSPTYMIITVSVIALILFGLILFLYAIRWKISVNKDIITVHTPFRKRKYIRFDEISNVRSSDKGTVIYVHGKRLFFINSTIKMYSMFFTQLGLDGKDIDEPEKFTIRRSNSKKVEGFMWPLFSIGVLIWTLTRQTNPASVYEIIIFSAAVPVSLWYLIHCLRWKITALESCITIRTAFGEREYQWSDITKVNVEERKIVIITRDEKSIKVEGNPELVQKLQSEHIPFYKSGELI